MMSRLTIYTDGSCVTNPGMGGWAALIIENDTGTELELSGRCSDATNNQMELLAAIKALEAVGDPSDIVLITDSWYVKQGITEWIQQWMKQNWQTSSGSSVKNHHLWIRLHNATQRHVIRWEWVKGHSGDLMNDRVDRLARLASRS